MEPGLVSAYAFLVDFRESKKAFGDYINFEPKYKFSDLSTVLPAKIQQKKCFSKGRYCVTGNADNSLQLLDEAIYQKCVWLTGKQMKGYYREVWWNYVDKYYSYLTSANQTKNSSISKQILKQINAGAEFIQKTEKCYKNSFSIPDDKYNSENDVLRAEQSQKAYSHLSYIPGFFINGYLIRENLKVDIVVSAICDKLITQPDYCESFLTSRINLEYEKINVKNSFTWLILSLSFLCVFVLIIAIYAIKRCMRESISKEIEYQIDGYVSDYFRLESGKANLNV